MFSGVPLIGYTYLILLDSPELLQTLVTLTVLTKPLLSNFLGRAIVILNFVRSGSVVERPLCDREVAGSIPGRVIPKTLKMVLAALSLGAQH